MTAHRESVADRRMRLQQRVAEQRALLVREFMPVERMYARVGSGARQVQEAWPLLALVAIPLAALVLRRVRLGALVGKGLVVYGIWRRSAPIRALIAAAMAGAARR